MIRRLRGRACAITAGASRQGDAAVAGAREQIRSAWWRRRKWSCHEYREQGTRAFDRRHRITWAPPTRRSRSSTACGSGRAEDRDVRHRAAGGARHRSSRAADAATSFLYLPADAEEFKPEQLALPWGADAKRNRRRAGAQSRLAGADAAGLVGEVVAVARGRRSSTAPILPWQAAARGAEDVSPIEASARYLGATSARAWDHAHPDAPLASQDVLLTWPVAASSSTYGGARGSPCSAATDAGLPHVTLLEEPQAAFYSWLGAAMRRQLAAASSRSATSCSSADVGGSLHHRLLAHRAVTGETDGNLALERVAVGDHILLGGDNMDLAPRRRTVRARLEERRAHARPLAVRVAGALVPARPRRRSSSRPATDATPRPWSCSAAARRSSAPRCAPSFCAATNVERVLVDGFFLSSASWATGFRRPPRVGLRELGLPFAADAGITRHLSAFVRRAPQGRRRCCSTAASMRSLFATEDPRGSQRSGDWPAVAELEGRAPMKTSRCRPALPTTARAMQDEKGSSHFAGTARSYYLGIELVDAFFGARQYRPPLKGSVSSPFRVFEEGSAS